jgi:hypothetical protein
MKFIYGFAPKVSSIDELVDIKAEELARRIVLRTSHTMKLEDQGAFDLIDPAIIYSDYA